MAHDARRHRRRRLDPGEQGQVQHPRRELLAAQREPASVFYDPLDRAVEQLWFNGVVVVAAAGNYGIDGRPSGVTFAPGNDPFVITVGAQDIHSSVSTRDDTAAPWSAFGYTLDGFSKPELGAPGRYIVGPVPGSSTLVSERPTNLRAPGYMELSGTSFAAPVVAGAAAQILARHPEWTPDQVKGALMLTARHTPNAAPGSLGVGVLDAVRGDAGLEPAQPERGREPVRRARPPTAPASCSTPRAGRTSRWPTPPGHRPPGRRPPGRTRPGRTPPGRRPPGRTRPGRRPPGRRPPGHRPPGRARPGRSASWASASWANASWASVAYADNAEGEMSDTGEIDRRRRARRARHPARPSSRQHLSPGLRPGAHAFRMNRRAVPRTGEARDACGAYVSAMALRPHPASAWAKSPDGATRPEFGQMSAVSSAPPAARPPLEDGHGEPSLSPRAKAYLYAVGILAVAAAVVPFSHLSSRHRRLAHVPRPRRLGRGGAALRRRHAPRPELPHDARLPHPGVLLLPPGARRPARDRLRDPRVAEGSLPLVHPGLQHRQPHAERPGGVGGGRARCGTPASGRSSSSRSPASSPRRLRRR